LSRTGLEQECVSHPLVDEYGLEAYIQPLMWWQCEKRLYHFGRVAEQAIAAKPVVTGKPGTAAGDICGLRETHCRVVRGDGNAVSRGGGPCEFVGDVLADPSGGRKRARNAGETVAEEEAGDAGITLRVGRTGLAGDGAG
jgi:hypothetical protein